MLHSIGLQDGAKCLQMYKLYYGVKVKKIIEIRKEGRFKVIT